MDISQATDPADAELEVQVKPRPTHPTRERLLTAIIELMEENLPRTITSDMVLKHSGVSRGSLYHHFEDLGELIETALVQSFAQGVDAGIQMIATLVERSGSRQELFEGLKQVTRATQAPGLKRNRFQRARLIALSEENPRLTAALAAEQQRLTDAMTDLVREAQHKGWVTRKVDARAVAVFVQAYTLGKIVDDIIPTPMDPDDWNALIDRVMERTFTG